MAKKLSSVLGIDIGSHSIKVCEVKSSGKGATVSALGIIATPEGAVDYGGIYNSDAVGAALKKVLSDSGASSSSAVVTIAGQHSVLVRIIDIPKVDDEKELASQVEWEINKNIPFAETTIQSDYKVFPGQDPNATDLEVVMAMSPQSAIDTVVECIKKSGRKPYAIDVQPLGLARSIQMSSPEMLPDTGVCIVDIGHSTTSINIFRGSRLILPRPVPGGGEMVTRALADSLQMGIAEAEEYKANSFSIPSTAAVSSGIIDPFSVGGVTQSFDTGFNPGGYQAAGLGDYDATSGVTTGIDAYSGYAADPLDIDPVTGLPVEAPVVADLAPTYSNDPFAVAEPASGDLFTESFDPAVPNAFASPDATPEFTQGFSAVPEVAQSSESFESVRGILEDLVSELRRSIDYYSGRGGAVTSIYLCGGGAKLNGLAGYVERSLNIHTELYDPLKNLGLAPKKVGMDYINEYREQFTVAVGNGLHILFD
jgi:type IV pilus assembly protein PilM